MPAAIYGVVDRGTQAVPLGERVCHIYDAAAYWYHVPNPDERHGIGIVGRGREGGGRDVLLPSLDWVEDTCVYNLGAGYFRDTNCPRITIAADGEVSHSGLAIFSHDGTEPEVFNNIPAGLYCASSVRYTDKLKARDYDQYDPSFHRVAGIAGYVTTSEVDTVFDLYGEHPHGSQFNFDVRFANRPSLVALWALHNMNLWDVYWRFSPGGFNDNSSWSDYNFSGCIQGAGPNFYARNVDIGTLQVPYLRVRNVGAITIGGVSHTLVMVSVDWPITTSYGHKSFEAPYYRLYPEDFPSSAPHSAYLLDEWVTVHKPTDEN